MNLVMFFTYFWWLIIDLIVQILGD